MSQSRVLWARIFTLRSSNPLKTAADRVGIGIYLQNPFSGGWSFEICKKNSTGPKFYLVISNYHANDKAMMPVVIDIQGTQAHMIEWFWEREGK
ncbi:hypothetical protein D1AOALGA4SA_2597 [Olavius algarvensis Delta 1 endosymbiont]|nr:hypothetical protein D1AOALGA4SA_2597 [Olavius algarvensis Delta 1 endosymbiont]